MDPTNTPPNPSPETSTEPDPFLAQTMKDLGLLLKDGEIQAAPKEQPGDAGQNENTPQPLGTPCKGGGRRRAGERRAAPKEHPGEAVQEKPTPPPLVPLGEAEGRRDSS